MEQDSILRTWGTCFISNLQPMLVEKARVTDCTHHFACLQKCLFAEKNIQLYFQLQLAVSSYFGLCKIDFSLDYREDAFCSKGSSKKKEKLNNINHCTQRNGGLKVIGIDLSALQQLIVDLDLILVFSDLPHFPPDKWA